MNRIAIEVLKWEEEEIERQILKGESNEKSRKIALERTRNKFQLYDNNQIGQK